MRPLIFERPELQAPQQRVVFGLLTLAFWMLWVYLWLPVISLVAWAFGGTTFYREMIERSGYQAVVELLIWYGAIVAVLGGGLVLWAFYNWFRFRSGERRQPTPALTTSELADFFRVDETDLARWHASRRAVVHRNAYGEITAVDVDGPIARPTLRPLDTHGPLAASGRGVARHAPGDAESVPPRHPARARANRRPS